ncbi:hypothetical protein FD20_GL000010 [Liquorilactobacillus uvarum DSM 19971]|uniref:Uncharacterized protein n=2 Tax=Liquorilactobacillus uvarum TaxID=303240 RepID=A0A0R1Q2T4_9LACO|nr:hypothetical protein FD20_GL000010 [Liquorilactobacillus uvarum DSM 19971]
MQKNKKIATIISKESMKVLSDLAGDLDRNEKKIHKGAPKEAKASYRYELREVEHGE